MCGWLAFATTLHVLLARIKLTRTPHFKGHRLGHGSVCLQRSRMPLLTFTPTLSTLPGPAICSGGDCYSGPPFEDTPRISAIRSDSSLGIFQRFPSVVQPSRSPLPVDSAEQARRRHPSGRERYLSSMFRPRGFAPPRRLTPSTRGTRIAACCRPWGSLRFQGVNFLGSLTARRSFHHLFPQCVSALRSLSLCIAATGWSPSFAAGVVTVRRGCPLTRSPIPLPLRRFRRSVVRRIAPSSPTRPLSRSRLRHPGEHPLSEMPDPPSTTGKFPSHPPCSGSTLGPCSMQRSFVCSPLPARRLQSSRGLG